MQFCMTLEVDNKWAVYLVYNYCVGGTSRHVETRQYFLRKLKEEGIIKVIFIPSELNSSDLYMKNLARAGFEKHAKAYVGDDKSMKGELHWDITLTLWEGVRCVG
jgi:hypothetical protein